MKRILESPEDGVQLAEAEDDLLNGNGDGDSFFSLSHVMMRMMRMMMRGALGHKPDLRSPRIPLGRTPLKI